MSAVVVAGRCPFVKVYSMMEVCARMPRYQRIERAGLVICLLQLNEVSDLERCVVQFFIAIVFPRDLGGTVQTCIV